MDQPPVQTMTAADTPLEPDPRVGRRPYSAWEIAVVVAATLVALTLGFANLGAPSLWHDELVHVYLAKGMLDDGSPSFPSGKELYAAVTFNTVVAGFIAFFGDAEAVVRAPSVLLSAANVLLVFLLARRLLDRPAAAIASVCFALSPWTVAWARQARFYTLQITLFLLFLWAIWELSDARRARNAALLATAVLALFLLGVVTSTHSILFLGPVGLYSFLMWTQDRRPASRWGVLCTASAAASGLTLVWCRFGLDPTHADTIFQHAGLGGRMLDATRQDRLFYLRWLFQNLSAGYFMLALVGFAAMLLKEGRRGLFVACAFWLPLLALTFFVGYRRPRFMLFVFPFYVMAFSYGIVALIRLALSARRSWWRGAIALILLVFGARLAVSTYRLISDSVEVARGADLTLARRHPQWRGPCRYVKSQLQPDDAVLTTTYLPVLYYVGRVDDWFPSAALWWEEQESGITGLAAIDELRTFLANHPKGYYIAESWRIAPHGLLTEEFKWVETHMTRLDQASSKDVAVYTWGMEKPG